MEAIVASVASVPSVPSVLSVDTRCDTPSVPEQCTSCQEKQLNIEELLRQIDLLTRRVAEEMKEKDMYRRNIRTLAKQLDEIKIGSDEYR